ncbi:MAG: cupin domain-containing protein, partial [Sulfitobacter sp.]
PNGKGDPLREWDGQTFVHHVKQNATWQPAHIPGFDGRDTGITEGTKGVAGIHVLRAAKGTVAAPLWSHDADIHFTFVMEGQMTLRAQGQEDRVLQAGDGFVIPPDMNIQYVAPSADIELLEVSLRGDFNTVFAP